MYRDSVLPWEIIHPRFEEAKRPLADGALRSVRPDEELKMPGVLLHPVPAAALCTDMKEEILWRKTRRGISKRGGPEA
jgi:hypothetical protein